ncbi:MAG: MBL fold metallo-hydrolase [Thermoplasmata archaeon]
MVQNVKIYVLNDNEPEKGLKNDWGWSAYIESEKWAIIFDADTKPEIIEHNAAKMNLNLKKLKFAFLSHYHHDHYGGFEYLGKISNGLKVFTPEDSDLLKKWGLEPVYLDKPKKIEEDIFSTGPLVNGEIKEHAMIINVSNYGSIVIVGCSHPGIANIVAKALEISAPVHMVIGGFHSPPQSQLDDIATKVRYICPAHCSGNDAKNYIKSQYSEKFCAVKTGSIIEL